MVSLWLPGVGLAAINHHRLGRPVPVSVALGATVWGVEGSGWDKEGSGLPGIDGGYQWVG